MDNDNVLKENNRALIFGRGYSSLVSLATAYDLNSYKFQTYRPSYLDFYFIRDVSEVFVVALIIAIPFFVIWGIIWIVGKLRKKDIRIPLLTLSILEVFFCLYVCINNHSNDIVTFPIWVLLFYLLYYFLNKKNEIW